MIGESGNTSAPAIIAYGATASSPALEVNGKVKFNRAGRKTIGAGKSTLVVTMAGVTSPSKVLAVLNSNRSGRYVRRGRSGDRQVHDLPELVGQLVDVRSPTSCSIDMDDDEADSDACRRRPHEAPEGSSEPQ